MKAKVKRQIILLSILLHILFLAFWESAIRLNLSRMQPQPLPQHSAPLVFDLQQPELPREVVATPTDANISKQPPKADFLSDKNALARNQESIPTLRLNENPYARGDFASHDLPPRPASPARETAAAQPREPSAESRKSPAKASQEPLTEKTAESSRPHNMQDAAKNKIPFHLPIPGVQHDHRDSQVSDSGGLSFNTYNWDFAPYMLELKERISRNIFPPLAFSQLGMIDGDTLLRFKIYPGGELRDLELLAYQGHRSLMETSTMAIKVSAPFRKLPNDFPEPYLEVTAKFSFFIKK